MFYSSRPVIQEISLLKKNFRGGDRAVMLLKLSGWGVLSISIRTGEKWKPKFFFVRNNQKLHEYIVPVSTHLKISLINLFGRSVEYVKIEKGELEILKITNRPKVSPLRPKRIHVPNKYNGIKLTKYNGLKLTIPAKTGVRGRINLPKFSLVGLKHGKWSAHSVRSKISGQLRFRIPKAKI